MSVIGFVRRLAAVVASIVVFGALPARAAEPTTWLLPPVDAPIAQPFVAPEADWGPGHRGVDYSVPYGTGARAAATGRVTFSGRVAEWLAVTLEHSGGLTTSYSRLSEVLVAEGEWVEQGAWVGRTGTAHGSAPGLHFSVRLNGIYVDPRDHLGRLSSEGAFHLAPLRWQPPEVMADYLPPQISAGTNARDCVEIGSLDAPPPAPNENIAVAIAGLSSHTRGSLGAEMYEHGPELLGYPPERVYRFSYRGVKGPDLHRPYDFTSTFGDIRAAAVRLEELLTEIARRHPGVDLDLIAHSQGGIVARVFLEELARPWDSNLPHIDHVVTFASPHRGAPLAGEVEDIRGTVTGPFVLKGLDRLGDLGLPIPDSNSPVVKQLAPGSTLLRDLTAEDVTLGTRVLALAIPNDVVVPADHSLWPGELSRVVGPSGLIGHAAIVSSPEARAIAHAFLRDGAPSCPDGWDEWGPRLGAAISWAEGKLDSAYRALEARLGGRLAPLKPSRW